MPLTKKRLVTDSVQTIQGLNKNNEELQIAADIESDKKPAVEVEVKENISKRLPSNLL